MNKIVTTTNQVIVQQADSDDQLIDLWLFGKSQHTQKTYRRSLDAFWRHTNYKDFRLVTLGDLQSYVDQICAYHKKPNSQQALINPIKSLLTFATKIGYLHFNVGAALRSPKVPNELAERILTEEEVIRLINVPDDARDRIMLRLLYNAGMRADEVRNLQWKHFHDCIITIHGKGDKTRHVRLSQATCDELIAYGGHNATGFIFPGRNDDSPLDASTIWRIAQRAAIKAGIEGNVSPHWLRHSHASHSLDRGATVAVVKETLGHQSVAVTSKYLHVKPEDSSSLYLPV